MAGGRSTRFGGSEKPMALLRGKPMIAWVVDALELGFAGPVAVAVSPRTPQTARWARARGLRVVETPGRGFVEDAALAARTLGLPLLVAAADLPLLSPEVVAGAIRRHAESHLPLSLWTPARPGDRAAWNGLLPVGLNLWASGPEERWVVPHHAPEGSVNTVEELRKAREVMDRSCTENQ